MKLIPTLTTKTKCAKLCSDINCKKDIEVGEKYFSVFYNDGFRKKIYGLYHKECWVRVEIENKL